VTEHDLLALRTGSASPERVGDVARHLAECSECRLLSSRGVDPARGAEGVSRALGDVLPLVHPDNESELVPYVDGALGEPERQIVDAHLEECAVCREDVSDLREMSRLVASGPRSWFWPALAAAALIVAGLLGLLLYRSPARHEAADERSRSAREESASHSEPSVMKAEWVRAVADARREGRLEIPARLRMLGAIDVFRGAGERAPFGDVSPARTVLDETQPVFRWTAVPRARYTVEVFRAGTPVSRSGPLDEATWRPRAPLERGSVYTWQVVAVRDAERLVLPAPPAPPAMFEIVDEGTSRDLAAARRMFPDDHFLLGVLYARSGIRGAALDELRRSAERDPNDETTRALLRCVESWR